MTSKAISIARYAPPRTLVVVPVQCMSVAWVLTSLTDYHSNAHPKIYPTCFASAMTSLITADTVYNMLEDGQGSKFTEAGVNLRTAAGIFERLHKVQQATRAYMMQTVSLPTHGEADSLNGNNSVTSAPHEHVLSLIRSLSSSLTRPPPSSPS